MIYAQIKAGHRLHLAFEAGEGHEDRAIAKRGEISAPICGERTWSGHYRMTVNVPLANACKRCIRVAVAMERGRK